MDIKAEIKATVENRRNLLAKEIATLQRIVAEPDVEALRQEWDRQVAVVTDLSERTAAEEDPAKKAELNDQRAAQAELLDRFGGSFDAFVANQQPLGMSAMVVRDLSHAEAKALVEYVVTNIYNPRLAAVDAELAK